MSATWKQGSFTSNTVTGNQTIDTGTGVVGKALILFATQQTAEGIASNSSLGIGFATSSSSRGAVSFFTGDNLATTDGAHGNIGTKCLQVFSAVTPTVGLAADFVSFGTGGDAGKFTINLTTAPATGYIVHYIFIGGDDITNATVVQKAWPTSTGNSAVTGVGFQGDAAIFITTPQTSAANANGSAGIGIGCAVSATQRGACSTSMKDASTMTAVSEYVHSGTKCLAVLTGTTLSGLADFVSWGSDGYTINVTTAPASAWFYYALVIQGGTWDVESISCPASTGSQSITTGFPTLGALMFGSGQTAADDTMTVTGSMGIGAIGNSPVAENNVAIGISNAINIRASMRTVTTKGISSIVTTSTVTCEADNTSLNSDGFTINWSTVTSGCKFVALAMGSSLKITGVTRDSSGSALATCDCYLFKESSVGTVSVVGYQQSDGSGNFSFRVPDAAAKYFVAAFKSGSPARMDVSDRVLQGV